MANLNRVLLIGRLTRDPEVRTFSTGGKVAKFGFAVNNRKKNQSTGQWEDEPVFLDVEAFNRGDWGKMADTAQNYLSKGKQIFIEGHLRLDQWTSQDGQKRSKLIVIADSFQFLDPKGDSSGGGSRSGGSPQERKPAAAGVEESPGFSEEPPLDLGSGPPEGEIPF